MPTLRPLRARPTAVKGKPHPGDLLEVIHRLVMQQRITYGRHALEVRMPERGFDTDDVEYILTNGMIQEGDIKPGKKAGDWECLVVSKLELGGRDAGVATVVVRKRGRLVRGWDRLIVKTVEWIDP